MNSEATRNWTLRELKTVLFAHWKLITAFVFLSTIGILVGLYFYPPTFQSEAKLFVRLGRENVGLDSTAAAGQTVSLNATREADINSVMEHLESRSIIEKLLDRMPELSTPQAEFERELAIEKLSKRLRVTSPRQSYVIRVQFEGDSPQQAKKALEAMLDIFLEEHMLVTRNRGSFEFFEEQTNDLKEQLEQATAKLRDTKNSYNMVSFEGRRKALEEELARVERESAQTSESLVSTKAKLNSMREKLATLPPSLVRQMVSGQPSDGLAAMRDRLFQVEAREKELSARKTPKHPEVIAAKAQSQSLRKVIESETPKQSSSTLAIVASEESSVKALDAKLTSLKSYNQRLLNDLMTLNEQEAIVSEAERKVKHLEAEYLTNIQRREQARIDEAMQSNKISNVSVMQQPTFDRIPASPKKKLILIGGFIFSLMIACGIAFMIEYFREPTNLPALSYRATQSDFEQNMSNWPSAPGQRTRVMTAEIHFVSNPER